MSRGKANYYDKRQIIIMDLVQPEDYEDRVIVCIPKFAWDVARAYLSEQAQWRSSYSMAYHATYYETPDDEEFDVIQASIDNLLAEDDMSCDIVAALESLQVVIEGLVAKECGVGCGGSGGAGAEEAPPDPFEDEGDNYPPKFESRPEFDTWRCGVATLIVDELYQDLDYLKSLAVGEISATALAFALATPIPLDDIAVILGIVITFIAEAILDGVVDEILSQLALDRDTLICALYEALDADEAKTVLDTWRIAEFEGSAEYLLSWFINFDQVNQLYERRSKVFGYADCSGCATTCHTDQIEVLVGTVLIDNQVGDTRTMRIASEYLPGPNQNIIQVYHVLQCCYETTTLEEFSPPVGGVRGYFIRDCYGTESSGTVDTFEDFEGLCLKALSFNVAGSGNEFTLDFVLDTCTV
jgi:hypothetical protein